MTTATKDILRRVESWPPEDQEELHGNVYSFLHKLAFWPERIISYFFHPAVQYAAANTV